MALVGRHTLRVSVDVAESSPDKDKLPFAIGDVGRTKQRRVEMVNGAFDLPTVALVDGASFEDVGVDARTLGASGKRALEFDFPHFDESVVYDPTLTVYTAEETEAVLQAIEQQGGGGEGGGGGGNVTGRTPPSSTGRTRPTERRGRGRVRGGRSAFAAGLAAVAVGLPPLSAFSETNERSGDLLERFWTGLERFSARDGGVSTRAARGMTERWERKKRTVRREAVGARKKKKKKTRGTREERGTRASEGAHTLGTGTNERNASRDFEG